MLSLIVYPALVPIYKIVLPLNNILSPQFEFSENLQQEIAQNTCSEKTTTPAGLVPAKPFENSFNQSAISEITQIIVSQRKEKILSHNPFKEKPTSKLKAPNPHKPQCPQLNLKKRRNQPSEPHEKNVQKTLFFSPTQATSEVPDELEITLGDHLISLNLQNHPECFIPVSSSDAARNILLYIDQQALYENCGQKETDDIIKGIKNKPLGMGQNIKTLKSTDCELNLTNIHITTSIQVTVHYKFHINRNDRVALYTLNAHDPKTEKTYQILVPISFVEVHQKHLHCTLHTNFHLPQPAHHSTHPDEKDPIAMEPIQFGST